VHVHAVENKLGRIIKQYSHLDTLWIVKKYHPFLDERQLLRLQLHEIVNYADVLLATVDGFHRRDLFHGQLRLPHFLYNVHARTGTLVGLSNCYYGYNSQALRVDIKQHFLSDEWRHDLHSGVAPEVLLGYRADARADVWSCGIMLLQLLSKNLDIVGASAPPRTYGEHLFGFLAHLLPRADIEDFVR
jgi:hypothetical protein